eukprot:3251380-Pyramimonas_sp.AAC.1
MADSLHAYLACQPPIMAKRRRRLNTRDNSGCAKSTWRPSLKVPQLPTRPGHCVPRRRRQAKHSTAMATW